MRPERRKVISEIVQRARDLRKDGSTPEDFLWGMLRNRRLFDLKFRRQHPFKPYVLDFYCAGAKLVVELDGVSHIGRAQYDDRRTRFIESKGLHVIRFTIDDLLSASEAVLLAI